MRAPAIGGIALAVATLVAGMRVRSAMRVTPAEVAQGKRAATRTWLDRDSLTRITDLALERSPFRLAAPADDPTLESSMLPEPAPTGIVLPDIELKAIVGGPPWRGVLSGIPGTAGDEVVRPGDQFADFRVAALAARSATLRWNDTTWTITLKGTRP
jgi:hypothetical protein